MSDLQDSENKKSNHLIILYLVYWDISRKVYRYVISYIVIYQKFHKQTHKFENYYYFISYSTGQS